MKNTSFRARTLACALLASTAYCGLTAAPAAAQSNAQPAYRALDENGVDLTHGDFVLSFLEGSIGSGEGELALVRERLGNDPSSWDGIRLTESVAYNGHLLTVSFGNRWEQFLNGVPKQANGATIAAHGDGYVYRAADGTATFFEPFGGFNACTASSTTTCRFVPTSIVGADGRKVELYYDRWNICGNAIDDCTVDAVRLSQVRNSFGYLIEFQYAAGGSGGPSSPGNAWYQRTSATFSNDIVGGGTLASVSYSYPSSGVTEVTDMGGRVWRFTGSGRITGIRRPGAASDTTVIAYSGNEVTSVTRDGVTANYSRSPNGSNVTTTVTNALNQATTVVSDLNVGRPVSITDPLNRTTSYQYDPSGRLTRQTEPEGNYVQYTHDARGNVTQTQAVPKPGSSAATITTSASYDANCSNPVKCNQPNWIVDARGNATSYHYDQTHGGLIAVVRPPTGNYQPETRYSYTLLNGEYRLTGTSECMTGNSCADTADEVKSTLQYDVNGNVTSISTGSGDGSLTATQAMTYDGLGNVLTVDGPLSGADDTTRFRYNGARELIGTISADPDGAGPLKHRASRTTIDGRGVATKVETGTVNSQSDADWASFNALEAAEVDYDVNLRPTAQKLVSGGTVYALTQTSYDALGRPECTAQRMNPSAFTSLPNSACGPGAEGSFGPDRIVKSVYDAASQVTQVRTAVGTADEAAEVTSTYTSNGEVQTLTDGENNKTTYEYDGHDRLVKTFYPVPTKGAGTSSTTDYEQLSYDPNGNVYWAGYSRRAAFRSNTISLAERRTRQAPLGRGSRSMMRRGGGRASGIPTVSRFSIRT